MKIQLRSSVSIVYHKNNIIEFFKTNTREQIMIKAENKSIKELLSRLGNGFDLEEYIVSENIEDRENIHGFISFLMKNGIVSTDDIYNVEEYDKYRRVIHFLEDYASSSENLNEMWSNIRNSRVLIVGLGAVGTWVAINLLQSGVKNFVIIDDDQIELSNMHRQYSFSEEDIGMKKGRVLKEKMLRMDPNVSVDWVDEKISHRSLESLKLSPIDLAINTADEPNVDTTSLWIGEYCMKRKIPHIIGGGYNMHLSLVGQTVLPYQSACVKCFEKELDELNSIDKENVKKLAVKNRKVGSFGPMTAIISSFIGMESLKVLSQFIEPANLNRRGEFNIKTMSVSFRKFERRMDCEWCGGSEDEE